MSTVADQDFRDENSSSRSPIIPYSLYRAIAPRRARVSPLFYACIESQTLKLAKQVARTELTLADRHFCYIPLFKHSHLRP